MLGMGCMGQASRDCVDEWIQLKERLASCIQMKQAPTLKNRHTPFIAPNPATRRPRGLSSARRSPLSTTAHLSGRANPLELNPPHLTSPLRLTMVSSTTASQEELIKHQVPVQWRDNCSACVVVPLRLFPLLDTPSPLLHKRSVSLLDWRRVDELTPACSSRSMSAGIRSCTSPGSAKTRSTCMRSEPAARSSYCSCC